MKGLPRGNASANRLACAYLCESNSIAWRLSQSYLEPSLTNSPRPRCGTKSMSSLRYSARSPRSYQDSGSEPERSTCPKPPMRRSVSRTVEIESGPLYCYTRPDANPLVSGGDTVTPGRTPPKFAMTQELQVSDTPHARVILIRAVHLNGCTSQGSVILTTEAEFDDGDVGGQRFL